MVLSGGWRIVVQLARVELAERLFAEVPFDQPVRIRRRACASSRMQDMRRKCPRLDEPASARIRQVPAAVQLGVAVFSACTSGGGNN